MTETQRKCQVTCKLNVKAKQWAKFEEEKWCDVPSLDWTCYSDPYDFD